MMSIQDRVQKSLEQIPFKDEILYKALVEYEILNNNSQ